MGLGTGHCYQTELVPDEFITVLVYRFAQIICRRLGEQKICASWRTLRGTAIGPGRGDTGFSAS